jgi:hypothetical protein
VSYLNRNRVQREFSALNDQTVHSFHSSLISTFMNSKAASRTDMKHIRETQILVIKSEVKKTLGRCRDKYQNDIK